MARDEKSYADIYDEGTIERCRFHDRYCKEAIEKIPLDDPERDAKINLQVSVRDFSLYCLTGDRAIKREAWIREQKLEESRREKRVANARPLREVICKKCGALMNDTYRCIDRDKNDRERVMMMFSCPNECTPSRAIYDDGTEGLPKPKLCKRCGYGVTETSSKDGSVISITSVCGTCSFSDTETIDLTPLPPLPQMPHDEEFEIDRARFCLDAIKTAEYRKALADFESLKELMKEHEAREAEKQKPPEPEIVVRMLKVFELQQHLGKTLEVIGFTKVEVSSPTSSKEIRIKLTALDIQSDRKDEEGSMAAKDALRDALADTNWRLVRGSLQMSLGALNADLKGVNNENEAKSIIRSERTPKDSWKVGDIIL